MIGSMIARTILDDRVVDMPFNSVFWDLILDKVIF